MDDRTEIVVTLADGTHFTAVPDGVGNLITEDEITSEMFTKQNLKAVTFKEGEAEPYIMHNLVNRTFLVYGEEGIMIRLDEMTEMEKLRDENTALQEANDMLTECILEMSEIIYGE